MPEPDIKKMLAMASKAAVRKRNLFLHLPDLTLDDLKQEAKLAVLKAGPVDPAKGAASTFWYVCASRRLIDLWRYRSRRFNSERGEQLIIPRPAPLDPRNDVGIANLADWMRATHAHCRRLYGTKVHRVGRRFIRTSHAATIVLLAGKTGLSLDAVRNLLIHRPDLLHSLGLRHVPGAGFFEAVSQLMRRKRINLSTLRN